MKNFPFLFVLLLLLLQCNQPPDDAPLEDITRLMVHSSKVSCVGLIEQECYQIKEGDAIPDGAWRNFYEGIVGFDYVPGFIYEIEVRKIERNPIPQDAGQYRYVFVRLISKISAD